MSWIVEHRAELVSLTLEHLALVLAATLLACAVGTPLGVALTRRPALAKPVLGVANILQTVPSLALFGFLLPVLGRWGIGHVPAVIALFLYGLLPIVRNTFAGIQGVDGAVRDAAKGLGMTDRQMLFEVELPLAAPVVIAGVRVATVIAVGTATIAAAIGAGGLGTFIFRGLRMNDTTLVLAGALPAAGLALLADLALGAVERIAVRERRRRAPRRATIAIAAVLALGLGALAVRALVGGGTRRVVVASKDFTEQVLLAEIVAQSLEARGVPVERQLELGGDLAHRGILSGRVDAYVEYSGTALMALLKEPPKTDPVEVRAEVVRAYPERFDAEVLAPLGFENTFAILVRGADARRLGLKTVSDLAKSTKWRAAFGQDFMSRPDGWAGFSKAYALAFDEAPREMDLSLTYRALAGGQVDVIAGNSTDGLIDRLDLVQLEDDRRYFPPYEALPVVRRDALARTPELRAVFAALAGKISSSAMRKMNDAVDGEHRDPKAVAAEFLAGLR